MYLNARKKKAILFDRKKLQLPISVGAVYTEKRQTFDRKRHRVQSSSLNKYIKNCPQIRPILINPNVE